MTYGPVPWDQQGCEICRRAWMVGQREPVLKKIKVSQFRRASLYLCTACHSFWAEYERFAEQIPKEAIDGF